MEKAPDYYLDWESLFLFMVFAPPPKLLGPCAWTSLLSSNDHINVSIPHGNPELPSYYSSVPSAWDSSYLTLPAFETTTSATIFLSNEVYEQPRKPTWTLQHVEYLQTRGREPRQAVTNAKHESKNATSFLVKHNVDIASFGASSAVSLNLERDVFMAVSRA